MDKFAKSIVIMLLASILIGLLVISINPEFRQTAKDIWNGQSTNSPIWKTNQDFYPKVELSHE